MEDGSALLEGVEVPAFHDISGFGNIVVGWDGDVSRGLDLVAVKQQQRNAALAGMDLADNERRRLVELALELRTS